MIEITAEILSSYDKATAALTLLEAQSKRYVTCHNLKQAHAALSDGLLPAWPALPLSEQFTTRGSSPRRYMYLYWGHHDGPLTPTRRQIKTYIGSRPARVSLARSMVQNREHWNQIRNKITSCRWAITKAETELHSITAKLDRATQDALGDQS